MDKHGIQRSTNMKHNNNKRDGHHVLQSGQGPILGPLPEQKPLRSVSLEETQVMGIMNEISYLSLIERPKTVESHSMPLVANNLTPQRISPTAEGKIGLAVLPSSTARVGTVPTATTAPTVPHTPPERRQRIFSNFSRRAVGPLANKSHLNPAAELVPLEAPTTLSAGDGLETINSSFTPTRDSQNSMNISPVMDIVEDKKATSSSTITAVGAGTGVGAAGTGVGAAGTGAGAAEEVVVVRGRVNPNPFVPRYCPQAFVARPLMAQNALPARGLKTSVGTRNGNNELNHYLSKDQELPQSQNTVIPSSLVNDSNLSLGDLVQQQAMPDIVKHEGLARIPELQLNEISGETQPSRPERLQLDIESIKTQYDLMMALAKNPTDALEDKKGKEVTFVSDTESVPISGNVEKLPECIDTKESTNDCIRDGEINALFSTTLPKYSSFSTSPGSRDAYEWQQLPNEFGPGGFGRSSTMDVYNSVTDPMSCIRATSHTAMFENSARTAGADTAAATSTSSMTKEMNETSRHAYSSRIAHHIASSSILHNSQAAIPSPRAVFLNEASVQSSISNAQRGSGCFSLRSASSSCCAIRPDKHNTVADPLPNSVVPVHPPVESTVYVPLDHAYTPNTVDERATGLAFNRHQSVDDGNVNGNIFSALSAHEKDQEWLQVPALFYLVFNLVKLHEVRRQQFREIDGQPKDDTFPLIRGLPPFSSNSTSSSSSSLLSSPNDSIAYVSSIISNSNLLRQDHSPPPPLPPPLSPPVAAAASIPSSPLLPPPPPSSSPSSSFLLQKQQLLLRYLYAQISLAVINLRRVLLHAHLTHWSDSELRRAVADVADAWESGGPQSSAFEKASLHLLNLVSADRGGHVTHSPEYSVWRYVGSAHRTRTLIALYAVMFIIVVGALVGIGLKGANNSIRITLDVVVGFVTTIMAVVAVLVIDHNGAASRVAEHFEMEMMKQVAEAMNDVRHDIDFGTGCEVVPIANNGIERVGAVNSEKNSVSATNRKPNDKDNNNTFNNDNVHASAWNRQGNHMSEVVHILAQKDEGVSSGALGPNYSQFETSTDVFLVPTIPHMGVHKHQHSAEGSSNRTRKIAENEYDESVESKTAQLRGDCRPTEQILPTESDVYDEVTGGLWKCRVRSSSRYRSFKGTGHIASFPSDEGAEFSNITKSTNAPHDSRNFFTSGLRRTSPEIVLDDDWYNTLLMSRLSFQQQQIAGERRQSLMLRSHITRGSTQLTAPLSSSSGNTSMRALREQRLERADAVVEQKEENMPSPLSLQELHVHSSGHMLKPQELKDKGSHLVSPNSSSIPLPAMSRVQRESLVSSGLNGLTITALVYTCGSVENLADGVLNRLWSRSFLILQSGSLEALDAAFQCGSERFKVFLLHAPDLDQEQLRIALSWAMNQRRPVFFFSAALSTMSSEIPYTMRLEMPLTNRDVDALILSGIGVDEEMSCVTVFRPSKQFKVPPYTLGRRLGGGAFGNVFEAEMEVTGARCAVKRMYLRTGNYTEEEGHGASAQLKEIAHEVEIMSQLCHPNIVQYLFCERDANCVSIFMELCSGGSLSSLIACGGIKMAEQVKNIFTDIIRAVSYLHGKHIVHRDLKPENVLFRDGLAKISDFGTAVLKYGVLNNIKGTFGYMAPEVLVGDSYGKSCDVWSIGCIAAEALGIALPHRALALPALSEKYRRMGMDEVLEVDCDEPSVADFLRLCLRRNPQARSNVEGLLEHVIFAPDDISIERWMITVAERRRAQRKWAKDANSSRSPASVPTTARNRADSKDTSETLKGGDDDVGKGNVIHSVFGSMSAMSLRSGDLSLRQTPWQSPMSPALKLSASPRKHPPQEKM